MYFDPIIYLSETVDYVKNISDLSEIVDSDLINCVCLKVVLKYSSGSHLVPKKVVSVFNELSTTP
jgi:hypothetical protein